MHAGMNFTKFSGRAVSILRNNIDTDQIIPARYVPYFSWSGYSNALFARWRLEPEFVLNMPYSQGASILFVGHNFGCGSSRESAVWALQQSGFRMVIANSFADIFLTNALSCGLAVAKVDSYVSEAVHDRLIKFPFSEMSVDFNNRSFVVDNQQLFEFEISDSNLEKLRSASEALEVASMRVGMVRDYLRKRGEVDV